MYCCLFQALEPGSGPGTTVGITGSLAVKGALCCLMIGMGFTSGGPGADTTYTLTGSGSDCNVRTGAGGKGTRAGTGGKDIDADPESKELTDLQGAKIVSMIVFLRGGGGINTLSDLSTTSDLLNLLCFTFILLCSNFILLLLSIENVIISFSPSACKTW